jgi:hypothetical protein
MKTAVEWLFKWMIDNKDSIIEERLQAFEQAKEMEKQNIIEAAYFGHLKGWVDCGVENSFGEEYYKETFKK